MNKYLILFCSAAVLFSAAGQHPAATDGKSGMVIVCNSSGDAPALRYDNVYKTKNTSAFAAKYLAGFLKRITGADFRIMEETQWDGKTPAFLVGNTAFARKNGIDFSTFKSEEWLYKSVGGNLILGGGENFGQLIAICKLLENELGCRYLAFDEQYFPKKNSLELPKLDRRGEPSFTNRSIYTKRQEGKLWEKLLMFFRFNRGTIHGRETAIYSKQFSRTHSLYKFVDPDKYFKDHPEYFSMNAKGERYRGHGNVGGGVCFSNPETAKIAEASLRKYIAADRQKYPRELWPTIYSIQQLDSTHILCLCPECKKITAREGTEAGILLLFLNRIGRAIAADFPEVSIHTLAYNSSEWAPKTIRPEKNVKIQYCDLHSTSDCYHPLTHPSNRRQLEILDSWQKQGILLYEIWDYWNMGGRYFFPPHVETMAHAIKPDLTNFHERGIRNFFAEAEHSYYAVDGNFYDLQLYLGLQLLDDITKDDRKLIEEFMRIYYGPAEKPVYAAYRKISEAVYGCPRLHSADPSRPYQTAEFMKEVYSLLKQGQLAVPEKSPWRYRVERELLPVLRTMVYFDNFRLGRSKKEVLDEYRTLLMRQLRYIYSAKELKKIMPMVEADINRISFEFKTPAKFASLPENEIRKFSAIDFKSGIVDDPESSLKKVVRIGKTHRLKQQENAEVHNRPCLDTQHGKTIFGVSNLTQKESWRINVDEMPPQDEKYHWYCIRNCHLGAQSDFWAWGWYNRCPLNKVYLDGADNRWDVWFSLKMVGPSYVIGSKQKNNFFLECVILTKPGAIK